ncbi:hypothetical protein ACFQ4O_11835 [Methylopila musalis]|uniref:Uncharacterized protein n=1 Tax=Methylopila musalis TaxID=1134781 RepID=A0ABW3ZA83_9HYPH
MSFALTTLSDVAAARVWSHVPWAQGLLAVQVGLCLIALAARRRAFRVALVGALAAAFLPLLAFNVLTGFDGVSRSLNLFWLFVFGAAAVAMVGAVVALLGLRSGAVRSAVLLLACGLFVASALNVPGWVAAAN